MKMIYKIKYISFTLLVLLFITSCNKDITDFGFDGGISGTVKDAAGNIVPGDITTANFIVRVQAEGDISTVDMRVKGDGTFENNKLYPAKSKVWISGPISAAASDTVTLDLSGPIVHDFIVTPVFTVATPAISGAVTASTASFTYSITANTAKTPSKRELYCSTIPYPNTSTGSGAYYSTVKVTLSSNSGTANVTGLTAGKKYYCRVGVQSSSSGMNFSDQIIINTPAK